MEFLCDRKLRNNNKNLFIRKHNFGEGKTEKQTGDRDGGRIYRLTELLSLLQVIEMTLNFLRLCLLL